MINRSLVSIPRSTRSAHRWKITDQSKRVDKRIFLVKFLFRFDDKFQTPLERNLFVQPWNFPFADINHDSIIDRGWKVFFLFHPSSSNYILDYLIYLIDYADKLTPYYSYCKNNNYIVITDVKNEDKREMKNSFPNRAVV